MRSQINQKQSRDLKRREREWFFFINTTYFPNNYRIAFANKNNIFHERFGRISSQTINDAYDHDNKGLRFYFEMNIFEEKFVCEGKNQISSIVIVFTELYFYYIYTNLVCYLFPHNVL